MLWAPYTVGPMEFKEVWLIAVLFDMFLREGLCGPAQDLQNENETNRRKERPWNRVKAMAEVRSNPECRLTEIVRMCAPLPDAHVAPRVSFSGFEAIFLQVRNGLQHEASTLNQ